jgi:septal ring factor EnvC (AmiA/AmiB activator)
MVKNYNRLVEEAAEEIEEEIKEEMEDDRKALLKDLSDCNSRFDELKAAHSEIEDEHSSNFKELLELRKKVEKLSDENEIFREVIEEMLGLLNEEDREKLVRKLTA